MCGIYGSTKFSEGSSLDRISTLLRHRGPDDKAVYRDERLTFLMRRLAIVDLTPDIYPMVNEDETIITVFNGEIYNFQKLRDQLVEVGHHFKTNSDAEVLVHGYEEWGFKEMLRRLNGMFAVALYDKPRGKLFLARDRLGIKPLYYAQQNNCLSFASELKTLVESRVVPKKVDPQAVKLFQTFPGVPMPGPITIWQGIQRLPPGHYLEYQLSSVKSKLVKYWDLPVEQFGELKKISQEEAVERVWQLLQDSVNKRLLADVPLGAFLSGGLDSSTIVGLMAQQMDQPVKTFSVGFSEKGHSELEHARTVAKHFNTDHHEIIVKPHARELLEEAVWYFDEPFGDPAAISTYLVSKLARENDVTVALSGEGADELFFGYERYEHLLGQPSKKGLKSLLGRFSAFRERFYPVYKDIDSLENLKLLENKMQVVRQLGLPVEAYQAYFDHKYWLPDDLLMKVDRMSMWVSLEARVPFLDHRLVELAWRLPSRLKYHNGQRKYLLRKAAERILPRKIQDRPKHSFHIPVEEWVKGELRPLVKELIVESKTEFWDYKQVRRKFTQHLEGVANYRKYLWKFLVFELWARRFGVA